MVLVTEALGSTCPSAKMAKCPLALCLEYCPYPRFPGHDRHMQITGVLDLFYYVTSGRYQTCKTRCTPVECHPPNNVTIWSGIKGRQLPWRQLSPYVKLAVSKFLWEKRFLPEGIREVQDCKVSQLIKKPQAYGQQQSRCHCRPLPDEQCEGSRSQ